MDQLTKPPRDKDRDASGHHQGPDEHPHAMTGAASRRRAQRLRLAGVPRATLASMARGGLGAGLAIGGLAWLGDASGHPLLVAPMGASACLVFGAPESPFAQPRNTIGGHLIGALCGFAALALLGQGALALAAGVGLAVALMIVFGSVHPPAAANPVLIVVGKLGPGFLVTPLAGGLCLMVALALVFNRATGMRYPKSWW